MVRLITGTGCAVTALVHGGAVLVGEHTPPLGGLALAVLVNVAGGFALTVAVIVYVTKLPGGNVASVSAIAPVPVAAHVAPAFGVQVQVWLAMPVGSDRSRWCRLAATDPVLLTTTVYVIVPFGVAVFVSAVLAIADLRHRQAPRRSHCTAPACWSACIRHRAALRSRC